MSAVVNGVELTENDTLKNIFIMTPLLDEVGQNRVFGLMCGLLSGTGDNTKGQNKDKATG